MWGCCGLIRTLHTVFRKQSCDLGILECRVSYVHVFCPFVDGRYMRVVHIYWTSQIYSSSYTPIKYVWSLCSGFKNTVAIYFDASTVRCMQLFRFFLTNCVLSVSVGVLYMEVLRLILRKPACPYYKGVIFDLRGISMDCMMEFLDMLMDGIELLVRVLIVG